MPLPLLLLAGAAIASAFGYAAKQAMEDDDSSSSNDDDSFYKEERRRQEKAKRKAKKEEKARKIKALEIDFACTGEKYRHDITSALKNLLSLHFEKNPGFCCTLGKGIQRRSGQKISETNNHSEITEAIHDTGQQFSLANIYCTPEVVKNLSLTNEKYSKTIFPSGDFNKINESLSAINDLKHKKPAQEKQISITNDHLEITEAIHETGQQLSWTKNYCTPEIAKNLSFLIENYAVTISPSRNFKKISKKIDKSLSAINDLKHKKITLKKMKNQLNGTPN